MSLIKIIANKIELDIVKETLTIVKENNAFISDFKVSYSNFPFLIAESLNTVKALGTRDLTSINKPKIIEVTVEELGQKYYGELQILSYLNGFRKVTLKYGTELLKIMETKISDFMPIVSVIPGVTNPVPFVESISEITTGYFQESEWKNYPVNFINKEFPEVKWQFPSMQWKDKFGKTLDVDDDWFDYQNFINKFNDDFTEFIQNTYVDTSYEVLSATNNNVPSPQVYLLSPLIYALEFINFKAKGDFIDDDFVKKILFQSDQTNLCEKKLQKLIHNYSYSGVWDFSPKLSLFYKSEPITAPYSGNYTLDYSFTFNGPASSNPIALYRLGFISDQGQVLNDVFLINDISSDSLVVSGSLDINIPSGLFNINFFSKNQTMPVNFRLELRSRFVKNNQFMHPTIEVGRYLPDWTFGTYLNELKKFFNLKIDINDFYKTLELNLNENFFADTKKLVINKSLEIKEYDQPLYDSFHLKFQNDDDTSLWINSAGSEIFTNQTSNFSQKLESKFKLIPHSGLTSELSEELSSKDGVGLILYDPNSKPYVISHYINQTLSIEGQGGIYETFWKKSLKFYLAASGVIMTGYFTEIELSKIAKIQRVYIDHQDYIVSLLEYSETEQNNFEVTLKLKNINF